MENNMKDNMKDLAAVAINELFENIKTWAEKHEKDGLTVMGIFNVVFVTDDGDIIDGAYQSNVADVDIYEAMCNEVKDEIFGSEQPTLQ